MRMSREAKQYLFLSRMSGNGQGGKEKSTDFPLRKTLDFIVSSGAIGSSDRKDGFVEYVCACDCVRACMILYIQMQ